MLAEWSIECAAEDPVLVVPWSDPDGKAAFVDLRSNPHDFDAVAEAELHPPLMQALRALNATRSAVFTAKCDAWPLDAEELQQLQLDLNLDFDLNLNLDLDLNPNIDLLPADTHVGFASYIDLVWRDHALFSSFHRQEQMLRRLTRLAAPLDHPSAALDCVLRPALLDLDGPREGFALSLYVKALGPSPQAARKEWADALATVVELVRGRSFAR